MFLPSCYFMTSGIGQDEHELVSFDKALFHSGIANFNLVKVSSILPPDCRLCNSVGIPKGSILFSAYSSITSCSGDTPISAAIGVGIPNSSKDIGVIMEYSCGDFKRIAEEHVERMIVSSMDLRNIKIKEIKICSSDTIPRTGFYSTALAALVMW